MVILSYSYAINSLSTYVLEENMIQVAEIIYVVPEEREAYLEKQMNPSLDAQRVAWSFGIRNRCVYRMSDYVIETFDYDGKHFYKDMAGFAAHPLIKETLIQKRRKDVPKEELMTTNWWAPLKILARTLTESPIPDEVEETMEEMYRNMVNGYMAVIPEDAYEAIYDEDDWSESAHI